MALQVGRDRLIDDSESQRLAHSLSGSEPLNETEDRLGSDKPAPVFRVAGSGFKVVNIRGLNRHLLSPLPTLKLVRRLSASGGMNESPSAHATTAHRAGV